VFAHRAATHAVHCFKNISFNSKVPDWNAEGTMQPNEMILITENMNELQNVMSNYVGIVRTNHRLKRAIDRLRILYGETESLYERTVLSQKLLELRNLINVAYLIVKFAKANTKNSGLHYNLDNKE